MAKQTKYWVYDWTKSSKGKLMDRELAAQALQISPEDMDWAIDNYGEIITHDMHVYPNLRIKR